MNVRSDVSPQNRSFEDPSGTTARIEIWSDYVCPFCYLRMPVLDEVRARFDGSLDTVWHAYELRPAPGPTLEPDGAYLHRVWNASVYPMAREVGLNLRLPPVQPYSRAALEAAEHAKSVGRFEPFHHAMFRAFFEDGRDISRNEVICDVARSAGMDADATIAAIRAGTHGATIDAARREAGMLGIQGVPGVFVSAGTARRVATHPTVEALLDALTLSG